MLINLDDLLLKSYIREMRMKKRLNNLFGIYNEKILCLIFEIILIFNSQFIIFYKMIF